MKRHFRFACLLLTLFSLLACEQEDVPYITPPTPPDFREPYTGLFHFTSNAWSTSMGVTQYWDTVTCNGTVKVSEVQDSILEVRFRTSPPNYECHDGFYSSCISLRLHSAGRMSFPALDRYAHVSFFGEFFGWDSLSIEFGEGGLGSQGGYMIRGKRVK